MKHWEDPESKVKTLIKENIYIEGNENLEGDIDGKLHQEMLRKQTKRTESSPFFSCKDKQTNLANYKQKQLWDKIIFIVLRKSY